MNERSRITSWCEVKGCSWRVHGSLTYDRVIYMLKTHTDNHNCLAVPKNRDVTSVWLGKIFETFIKENPYTNIKVLGAIILRQCKVIVPDHTLYRAKKYVLKIREEDHKQSYNKLYSYGHIILERNLGSYVKLSTSRYNPNPQVPTNFQRFYLSFQAQNVVYLQRCRPFIGLDGCHLKGLYEGILLCAIAMDANYRVYMVALGVIEIDCLDSWRWFLDLLHPYVGLYESREKAQKQGRYLEPLRCGEYEFEIIDWNRQFVVELDKRTCQCGIWVISGVPCKHVMACITKKRDNVEDCMDDYLKKATYLKTYSNNIHAIPDENLWPNGEFEIVLQPVKRMRAGRLRLSRRKGSNELRKQAHTAWTVDSTLSLHRGQKTPIEIPLPSRF
ncbi:hypothetical protein EZV62_007762 [Acer yangbiense]|uniref:SWIM-type domain-containing protein n=1 Tax=Acer yangbiense TaxID=1000413 RepID=A0A5C7IBA0_9ROSI|nr:hypothetical protein EZV62_007762 [Acer yangbiense]